MGKSFASTRSLVPAVLRAGRRTVAGPIAGAIAPMLMLALMLAPASTLVGCGGDAPEPIAKSPATLAAEEKAGDFLDYYENVTRLARRYAADADSFRIGLDALPGSHLSDEEWSAWTAPYEEEPGRLAERIEQVLTDLAGGRK